MTTNFLDPIYYDVSEIPEDTPNKALLAELYQRENEQNERLFYFFTEMVEDPQWKPMSANSIKPRTLRRKKAAAPKPKAIDKVDSDEFMEGYKNFMKEEFNAS